ncbi:uncharacterized protein LOC114938062 [Nylanderia fulva]|uniref:uncharacterized protein LOC114938062 n=1 Tax=Nylanderia fulva TaxID=613905 RepID=UPI0010FB5BBE|nr:uncharacterized protein LOC114938062 [Nylanderia fulva]
MYNNNVAAHQNKCIQSPMASRQSKQHHRMAYWQQDLTSILDAFIEKSVCHQFAIKIVQQQRGIQAEKGYTHNIDLSMITIYTFHNKFVITTLSNNNNKLTLNITRSFII